MGFTLKIIYILFLIFFLFYEPIIGTLDFKKFMRKQLAGEDVRLKYYKSLLSEMFIPAIIIMIMILTKQFRFRDVGISYIKLNFELMSKWLVYLIIIAVSIFFILIVYQIFAARLSPKFKEQLMKTELSPSVSVMLPQNRIEAKYWTLISVTAGITEELLYRGFLIFLLGQLLPSAGIVICIILSSIIFGLGHAYQGISGIIKTAILGLIFSLIYITTETIFIGIALHFLIDFSAKDLTSKNPNS